MPLYKKNFKEFLDKFYAKITHNHGNITNEGKITNGASKNIITDANGNITTESKDHSTSETTYGVSNNQKYGHSKSGSNVGLADVSGGAVGTHNGMYATADHQHTLSSAYATSGHNHDGTYSKITDIKDNLTSTDTNKPLSAKQGKELKTQVDAKTVTVEKQSTAESGFVATYVVKQNGTQVGSKINIPKDFLVKSASLKTCTTANTPLSGLAVNDPYLDFVINTVGNDGTDSHIYINVKDLVDTYTAGTGLTLSNGQFSLTDASNYVKKSNTSGYIKNDGTIGTPTNTTYTAESTATNIKMNGTQSAGSLSTYARGDHVHPTDTSRAASTHQHASLPYYDTITAGAALTNGSLIAAQSNGKYYNLATNGLIIDTSLPIYKCFQAVSANGTTYSLDKWSNNLLITSTKDVTLTANQPVYIEGSHYDNGLFTVSNAITQTLSNGKYYIRLGTAFSTTSIRFVCDMRVYRYEDYRLVPLTETREFGGVNLLLGTQQFNTGTNGSLTGEFYKEAAIRRYNNTSGTNYIDCAWTNMPAIGSFNAGDTFTLSFWAKGTGSLYCYSYGASGYMTTKVLKCSKGGVPNTIYNDGNCLFYLTSDWKRYYVTWQLDPNSTATDISKTLTIRTTKSSDSYIAGVMFERGEIAHDWSISPLENNNNKIVAGNGNAKDLNNYITPGFYYNDLNSDCAYISNLAESGKAFFLLVEAWGASNYTKQTITHYNSNDTYTRIRNSGTWGSWKKISADTNTTYSASTGLTLSGTAFSVNYGTAAGTACQGNDSRLSNARTPTSHTHGNITNAGAIGSTANLPIITDTNGVLKAGSFGTAANTFCQGNDSRLSNARTPTAHQADTNAYGAATTAKWGHTKLNSAIDSTDETTAATPKAVKTAYDKGNHSHPYVGTNDSRLTDARTPIFNLITASSSNIQDLNNYKTGGFYYTNSDANYAPYIIHCPNSNGTATPYTGNKSFFLLVETWGTTSTYVKQTLTYYTDNNTYTRTCSNGTWGNWKRFDTNNNNSYLYGGIQINANTSTDLPTQTFVGGGTDGKYIKLEKGKVLDIRYPIVYTNGAITKNTPSNNVYHVHRDAKTSNNVSSNWTTGNMIYLEGSAFSNGQFTINNVDAFITPTLQNGKFYIRMGEACSTTQVRFTGDMTVYYYNGTNLIPSVSWNAIVNKPSSYTPSSHTHGNLQNNGQVGSTAVNSGFVTTTSTGLITAQAKIGNIGIDGKISGQATKSVCTDANGLITTENKNNHTHTDNQINYTASTSNQVTPIDLAAYEEFNANRLAFLPPANITIKYSTTNADAGASSGWTVLNPSNADKTKLVSANNVNSLPAFTAGNGATASTNNRLQIILDAGTVTSTTASNIYMYTRKLLIYFSTNGATNCKCQVDIAPYSAQTTFTTLGTYDIAGNSGWNSIPISAKNFGGYGGQQNDANHYKYIRLTFYMTGTAKNFSVKGLKLIGETAWVVPSNKAVNGHIYTYDENQIATFPSNIVASKFIKNGVNNTNLLCADGSDIARSTFVNMAQGSGNANKTLSTNANGNVILEAKNNHTHPYISTDAGSVGASNLASNAVEEAKIKNDAVTSAKIADGTIVNANISTSAGIGATKIIDYSSTSYTNIISTSSNLNQETINYAIDAALGEKAPYSHTGITANSSTLGHVKLGTTSGTAAEGNHTHTGWSSWTTILNSGGYSVDYRYNDAIKMAELRGGYTGTWTATTYTANSGNAVIPSGKRPSREVNCATSRQAFVDSVSISTSGIITVTFAVASSTSRTYNFNAVWCYA